MKDIHEISRPAGPRPAGLSGPLSGASFSGRAPTSAAPAQVEPQPLKPPFPGMSQAAFADNSRYRALLRGLVPPPTSAPNQQEGGKKRKKKVFESLYDLIERKRAEGGQWPGEKEYKGPQQGFDAPKEEPKPSTAAPATKPTDSDSPLDKATKAAEKAVEVGGKMAGGEMSSKDVGDTMKELIPPKWREQRQRYPTTPANPPPTIARGNTRGNYRESTLITAVLQLQETQGGNLFEKAKKVTEGVGYAKDTTQSVLQGNRPINKSDRGIGQTTPLVQSYEGGKKRAEGGDPGTAGVKGLPGGPSGTTVAKPYQSPAGPPPSGGHLSQMGGGPGSEGKNYGGPASSLGGKLSQMGKSAAPAPAPSMTDKDLGGDAGGAAGAAGGAAAGASGGGEAGGAAAASGAATGSGGGKEGSTSPVSSGTSIGDTTVMGGPKQPPAGPSSTKTEGGKKSAHSRR